MIQDFTCPSCGNKFSLPVEKIAPQGSRGKCNGCSKSLMVFRDGRAILAESEKPQAVPQVSREDQDPPIWQVRLKEMQVTLKTPFRLADIRNMILEGKLTLEDEAAIQGAGWLPLKAYHAMDPFWAEKTLKEREEFGDLDHCVNHPADPSKWRCPKCLKFFCEQCVANKPFVEGGEPHYVCKACDMDLIPLKRKGFGLGSIIGSIKGKK